MLLLRRQAHARAGLVGNPSDGYHGKTIALSVRNFGAEVVLYEWEDVEILWTDQDQSCFRSVHDLVRDVYLHGTYEPLDPRRLPNVYIAYSTDEGEPTEVFHNDIRGRFNRGEPAVVQAMGRCAALAAQAREALAQGNLERVNRCINDNFDQ